MNLKLIREPTVNGATFGSLFIDGQFQCFTLEDAIREDSTVPISVWKVKGQTAIPSGWYRVDITYSNRFKRLMPIICDVPGFTGIRLHWGATIAHTEGCPLVGRARRGSEIRESRLAFEALFPLLVAALDHGIWIHILNPQTGEPPMVA